MASSDSWGEEYCITFVQIAYAHALCIIALKMGSVALGVEWSEVYGPVVLI